MMIQSNDAIQEQWGDGREVITQSSCRAYKSCPMRYFFRYVQGIRPAIDAKALRIGSNWHAAQELLGVGLLEEAVGLVNERYATCPDHIDMTEWLVERETLAAAVMAYHLRNEAEPLDVVATEIMFNLPIVNPETGSASTKWREAGKIDKIVRLGDGRLMVLEHKSTSDDLSPQSDYWSRLRIDSQISFYVDAARRAGYDVQGVLYDVFRKPQISPKLLTQGETKAFFTPAVKEDHLDGACTYMGQVFQVRSEGGSTEDDIFIDGVKAEIKPGAKPGTMAIRETPGMFGARLYADMASPADEDHKGPDYYFARREIARTAQDLEAFRYELWFLMQNINTMRNCDRWYRNDAACLGRGTSACDYCPICLGGWDLASQGLPQGFEQADFTHTELMEALQQGVQDYVTTERKL